VVSQTQKIAKSVVHNLAITFGHELSKQVRIIILEVSEPIELQRMKYVVSKLR
jgi:hypothetical protein